MHASQIQVVGSRTHSIQHSSSRGTGFQIKHKEFGMLSNRDENLVSQFLPNKQTFKRMRILALYVGDIDIVSQDSHSVAQLQ